MQFISQQMLPNPIFANMFKNKININLINSNNFTGMPVILPNVRMPNQMIQMNPMQNPNQMMNNPMLANPMINPFYAHNINRKVTQNNSLQARPKKKDDKQVKPNSMLNYIYGGQVNINNF
jgi:hypothetical protein